MAVFVALVLALIPLYLMIALGYIAGRVLDLSGAPLARLMLYLITPIIVFGGVMSAPLSPSALTLPFWVWGVGIVISLTFLQIGKRVLRDSRANILALAVGTGNTGYFGIPVALLLFGNESLGIYILCMLGTTLHENSVGFYLAAKGRYAARDCLMRVFRLPSLYAFLLAVVLNLAGLSLPSVLAPFMTQMQGAYTVLGMMIIGLGVAGMRRAEISAAFTGLTLAGKFVLWPALTLALCWFDQQVTGLFNSLVYQCLLLVAITPVAGNTLVIATLLRLHPGMVASTALLTTLVALGLIPLAVATLMPWLAG